MVFLVLGSIAFANFPSFLDFFYSFFSFWICLLLRHQICVFFWLNIWEIIRADPWSLFVWLTVLIETIIFIWMIRLHMVFLWSFGLIINIRRSDCIVSIEFSYTFLAFSGMLLIWLVKFVCQTSSYFFGIPMFHFFDDACVLVHYIDNYDSARDKVEKNDAILVVGFPSEPFA